MQICALSLENSLVFAEKALKQTDYSCVECQQPVRLRSGIHRQAHFYHVQPNRKCTLHEKGMPHLMLQYYIKNRLPEGEAELECRFPSIGRIADVAWHPKKLVFEVQYSPISAKEVRTRNKNYASLGYQVIWIFHEDRYNKSRLSAAEESVCDHPHYFSNMNAKGEGMIYDQLSAVVNGKRVLRLPKLAIDISSPLAPPPSSKLPFMMRSRTKTWPLILKGDTLDTYNEALYRKEGATEQQQALCLALQSFNQTPSFLQSLKQKRIFQHYILRPYRAFINLMLERACK